jgi:uncharacterized phiE125 gp8 family phage protein
MSTLREVIGSVLEPIDLDSAKEHLRVTNNDEDSYILDVISAARAYVENEIGETLHSATYNYYMDEFESDDIELPRPPLQSVTHVKYYDSDNTLQTLVEGTDYRVDSNKIPGVIEVIDSWPSTFERTSAVQIQFVAGESDACQYDPNVLHNIKMKISIFYDDRKGEEETRTGRATLSSTMQEALNKTKTPSF